MSEHRRLIDALWEITSLTGKKKPRQVDPEVLLARAQQEAEEVHARHRERGVQAITQKNHLEQMVRDLERRIDTLGEKIQVAEERGDGDIAAQFRRAREAHQQTLSSSQEALVEAQEAANIVKLEMLLDYDKLRERTVRFQAMATELQVHKVTDELSRQLQAETEMKQVFDENYTLYPLKTVRDIVAGLLAIIAALLVVLLFMALR